MPGEGGTFAVAANRLTYGDPFFKLDRLKPGDAIEVSTADGYFLYSVSSRKVRLSSKTPP